MLPDGGGSVGQGDLDEVRIAPLESQQADEGTDRDRLFDQCRHH